MKRLFKNFNKRSVAVDKYTIWFAESDTNKAQK